MTENELALLIEASAKKLGIAPTTLTMRAVNNSRVYPRLISGKSCALHIATRIQTFIREEMEKMETTE